MGTNRNEGTLQSFRAIYKKGGIASFWSGKCLYYALQQVSLH